MNLDRLLTYLYFTPPHPKVQHQICGILWYTITIAMCKQNNSSMNRKDGLTDV